MEPQVLLVCAVAFAAVFLLLSVISIAMTAITAAFPASEAEPVASATVASPTVEPAAGAVDQAMIAAITSTVMNLYPDACVSKIEELK